LAETTTFPLADEPLFKLKALRWAQQFQTVCLLDSNQYELDKYSSMEWVLAIDALDFCADKTNSFEALKVFVNNASGKIFGYLSYDLKNQIEALTSDNEESIGFPPIYFFKPRYIIEIKAGKVTFNRNYPEAFDLYERIMNTESLLPSYLVPRPSTLTPRTAKDKYISNVNRIKDQIKAGDFYEMNYCCEFYAERAVIEPLSVPSSNWVIGICSVPAPSAFLKRRVAR
jgi:para-aminobenzoate synthetase component 1